MKATRYDDIADVPPPSVPASSQTRGRRIERLIGTNVGYPPRTRPLCRGLAMFRTTREANESWDRTMLEESRRHGDRYCAQSHDMDLEKESTDHWNNEQSS